MTKIRIGSPVLCREGRAVGEVDRVVVDPKNGRLTHLAVRAKCPFTHDVVLPVAAVRAVAADAVLLNLSALEVQVMPDYFEEDYVSPAAEEMPAGPYSHGEVLFPVAHVRTGPRGPLLHKEVECRDGLCGTVDELLLDPVTRQVLSFRLHHAGALSRDVVVPIEWVLDACGERVLIDCNVRQLEELLPPAHEERAVGQ